MYLFCIWYGFDFDNIGSTGSVERNAGDYNDVFTSADYIYLLSAVYGMTEETVGIVLI